MADPRIFKSAETSRMVKCPSDHRSEEKKQEDQQDLVEQILYKGQQRWTTQTGKVYGEKQDLKKHPSLLYRGGHGTPVSQDSQELAATQEVDVPEPGTPPLEVDPKTGFQREVAEPGADTEEAESAETDKKLQVKRVKF